MKARANVRLILEKVGEIQTLIEKAHAGYDNDGGWNQVDRAKIVKQNLGKAQELCLEIRNMYDPI